MKTKLMRYQKDNKKRVMSLRWDTSYKNAYSPFVEARIRLKVRLLGGGWRCEAWLDLARRNQGFETIWDKIFDNLSDAIKWAYCAAETFDGPHMNTTDEAWLKEQWERVNEDGV